MTLDPHYHSEALFRSLIEAPLLVGDLTEAPSLSRSGLSLPDDWQAVDFQQKLGHLCEDALAVLFESSPSYDLLARNLQIQSDAHTTAGELDFLLRDRDSGQLVHLELATKFYLAVETDSGLLLPGPDARDNYFKKLHRLRSHQIQLSARYLQHLPEQYRGEAIVPRQLIHGCLFDHIDTRQPATPDFINPNCRRGRWLTIDEVDGYFPPGTIYEIIPKPLWPVPLELLEAIPLESWAPAPAIDRCVMLRVGGEAMPYFVTPAGYPGGGNDA